MASGSADFDPVADFLGVEDITAATLYAVEPLSTCPHLSSVRIPEAKAVDAKKACGDCSHTPENWLCLTCHEVLCSRYVKSHMVRHYEREKHPMCLSYADLSVWCYPCESYVHNEMLMSVKRSAHLSKFGVDMPGPSS